MATIVERLERLTVTEKIWFRLPLAAQNLWERIKSEIEKCLLLLCANCHAKVHELPRKEV